MKIVGNGAIAKAVSDAEAKDRLYFCSGVSNSSEVRESEYQREIDLLMKQDKDSHLVYFSSLGVLGGTSRYYEHKRQVEAIVKTYFDKYTIVRLGNITWKNDNPHTLINSMKLRVKRGEKLEIRDEYRYLVDKDEFLYWVNLIPEWSCEISIIGKRMKVREVVKKYVL